MQIEADTTEQYIEKLPDERKPIIIKLRNVILANIPKGFSEIISYGMIGYVVPHSIYPKGYHTDTKMPLPFINIASQKNYVAVYHMGIYSDKKLLDWFVGEYSKQFKSKLDMGKGCIRFKKPDQIPYELIGELSGKISVEEWIKKYEEGRKRQEVKSDNK